MWLFMLLAGASLALTGFMMGTYTGAFLLVVGLAACFFSGALTGEHA